MASKFQPMLAGKLDSLDKVRYPVACTPKIDGVRCVIHPELGPVSRTLKPIPNEYVRLLLSSLPPGLDGELMIPGAKNFGDVSGEIMRRHGSPRFEYHVFDRFDGLPAVRSRDDGDCLIDGYVARVAELADWALLNAPEWLFVLEPTLCSTEAELLSYDQTNIDLRFEGTMLREPHGPYKFGRSTVKEGWLLKLKRFDDAEAEIIGTEELHHNANEQERDERGYAKRSSAKSGQVAAGVLGALICRRPDGLEFRIGSGFTAEQRAELWSRRGDLAGQLVSYRFQPAGAKDAPRFTTYRGLRSRDDL